MKTGQLLPASMSLDDYVEAFEHAWQGNVVPELAAFAPPENHVEHKSIVLEMVRADLEFRWQRSIQKPLDQYAIEFPNLFEDEQSLSVLAFEEYRVRRLHGETLTPNAYADEYQIDVTEWPEIEIDSARRSTKSSVSAANPVERPNNRERIVRFPNAGTLLAGFQLQQELGQGAFSRVFLARQKDLADRFVVLKLSAEKFAEADKLAQLQHSNIVPIYSQHQFEDLSAVCMPYFGSTTLADLIASISGSKQLPPSGRAIVDTLATCARKTAKVAMSSRAESVRRLPSSRNVIPESACEPAQLKQGSSSETIGDAVPRSSISYDACLQALSGLSYVDAVLWLGERLADGLQHAHQRGILHHDLKPANVLLADDGRPMLLDFNLSADIKDSSSRRSLHIGGTLPYMAPEQLQGFMENAPLQDCRSDIYSLGVILFELVTGDLPFPVRQGSFREVIPAMISERNGRLPSVRRLNKDASPATEAIIQKCLAPNPVNRYQTAEQLQEDLSRQSKKLPLKHRSEPSLRERLQKWTHRHPRMSATLSVGSVLLLLLSVGGALFERKRFQTAQAEIATLVELGQDALGQDDPDVAQGRFLKAWMLAQAEPALQDQLASFAGWLDHARRATLQRQLKWHVPPRDFEMRRDEALLLSLLATKSKVETYQEALTAIDDSLTFATPSDPGWTSEADLLLLTKTQLLADHDGPSVALNFLNQSNVSESHDYYALQQSMTEPELRAAHESSTASTTEQFPIEYARARLLLAIQAARQQDFDGAGRLFEDVLDLEPQQFAPRFFHAVCLVQRYRNAEAEVALRACVAQRPDFLWSEYFLSVIRIRTGRSREAEVSLKKILEFSPSPALKAATEAVLNDIVNLQEKA